MKSTSFILFAALLFAGTPTANAEAELTPKCETPTLEGDSACWLKVENHDDCYIWFDRIRQEMTVTWSGQCRAGMPAGRGKMVVESPVPVAGGGLYGSILRGIEIGSFVDGRQHGRWRKEIMPVPNESGFFTIEEGSYINGKRHDEWTHRSGSLQGKVEVECHEFSYGGLVSKKDGFCDDPPALAKLTPKCKTPTTAGDKPCWLDVANHENCYVWITPASDESVTWSGRCKAGKPDGHGELMWRWDGGERTIIGSYVDGKKNGQWEDRFASDFVSIGPYVNDTKHGQWEVRYADGTVAIGHFVGGKTNGQWEIRWADGGVDIGSYVDGKQHGRWEIQYADGGVSTGPYVDDKRHGQWELRRANGDVHIGPYVDGKRNGEWEEQSANGDVGIGPYVNDKQNGQWELRKADGTVLIGSFVDGELHGRWEGRLANGEVVIMQWENGKVVK